MQRTQATPLSSIRGETNLRIYERNIPSQPLQPYLNVRPLNSKYTRLPIVEPRILDNAVPLKRYPVYSPAKVFYPASREAPYTGYAAAVNVESDLKGQIFALQKCSQAVWVPKSTSDLYQYSHVVTTPVHDPVNEHALLFHQEKFDAFDPNPHKGIVGAMTWGNNTRVQYQDVPEDYCHGNGSFQAVRYMGINHANTSKK